MPTENDPEMENRKREMTHLSTLQIVRAINELKGHLVSLGLITVDETSKIGWEARKALTLISPECLSYVLQLPTKEFQDLLARLEAGDRASYSHLREIQSSRYACKCQSCLTHAQSQNVAAE